MLLGCVLLIATVVSFPLYKNAAFDRMIRDEFDAYLADKGEWPFLYQMSTQVQNNEGVGTIRRIEAYLDTMRQELGLAEKERVYYYMLARSQVSSVMDRKDLRNAVLGLAMMSGLPEHAKVVSGSMYSESGLAEDGAFEAVASQECIVGNNLLLGETLELDFLRDKNGQKIRVKVVGVYTMEDSKDFYWRENPAEQKDIIFMNEKCFREAFLADGAPDYNISCKFYELLDYKGITALNVQSVLERNTYYKEESSIRGALSATVQKDILESYLAKQTRISATLFILQVPVLILLGAFLFMISGQMYDMEKNEISVMKSRGGSSGQMFRLYLYQSIFLTALGTAGGVPLGTVFCRILGSTGNFLEFDFKRSLDIKFDRNVWMYAAVAIASSILIMAIPALKHSRLTIVKLKQSNALRKKAWWEKIFLDVILLGVSLYGYYNFSKTQGALAASVVEGNNLDPLLYLSSSLFILGMGLLFLRLQPIVINLIFLCGRRFWSPASYASFMENVKNGRKQQFIMLFMILTISLGMYHAVVARTILQNAKDNGDYLEASDLAIKEVWTKTKDANDREAWSEPDYNKFASMPDVAAYTKVYTDDLCSLTSPSKTKAPCTVMAVHTKEYGLVTNLYKGLLEKPYREYLNELAKKPDGVLVSSNLCDLYEVKIGDKLKLEDRFGGSFTAEVVDFFDYWPGYQPNGLTLNEKGEAIEAANYLVIAHFSKVQSEGAFGLRPYEVWAKVKSGADMSGIYQWMEDNNVHVQKFSDKSKEMKKVAQDPLLQGTNGVLTMGFIVTIILCAVGYLIYWIMSIRSREMIFGVLRACGMHKGELFHMLINEQIFSGVLSIFAGIGIGHLASRMFVPLLQTAYAAADQVLPMRLIVNQEDMIRLYLVIAGVMALCLIVLILLVFKLNVTKALKLGEE